MGGATPKAKFNFNYNIFCCDFSPKSILLTNFLFTICLCAGMHTYTRTHTWILYYILIDTHAYRECILINRAQTQRSVPAPIGRHLAALQSSYRLFFYPPPSPYSTLPLPAPFTCVGSIHARIYLFTRCCPRPRRIFNFSLANWKSSNAKYSARCRKQHRNGDWPIPKSSI